MNFLKALLTAVILYCAIPIKEAQAQCAGQAADGQICGNATGATALPRLTPLVSFGSSIGCANLFAYIPTVQPEYGGTSGCELLRSNFNAQTTWNRFFLDSQDDHILPGQVTVGGTATAGNVLSISMTYVGGAGSPQTVSYTVQSGDTLGDIAQAFAYKMTVNPAQQKLVVTGGAGTFTNGESVRATGGGTGIYSSILSWSTVIVVTSADTTIPKAFTGTLTGLTSGATRTITGSLPSVAAGIESQRAGNNFSIQPSARNLPVVVTNTSGGGVTATLTYTAPVGNTTLGGELEVGPLYACSRSLQGGRLPNAGDQLCTIEFTGWDGAGGNTVQAGILSLSLVSTGPVFYRMLLLSQNGDLSLSSANSTLYVSDDHLAAFVNNIEQYDVFSDGLVMAGATGGHPGLGKINAQGFYINGVALTGTVTSVAQSFTGGLISVAGSPITSSGTLALTVAGTSGGIPYFSNASTWASSGALTANLPVIGGGAGLAPTVGTRSGNTTAFVTTTGTQTSGNCVSIDASGNHIANGAACQSGTVTSIATTSPITGGTITTTGTIACATCVTSAASLTANSLMIGSGSQASAVTTTGTGVLTALGVNTGSAGAFVVNGGALGSPSSAGTMPAFSLGGTVSGGGNNINNINIGATSPGTGAFSTINATGAITGLSTSTLNATGLKLGAATARATTDPTNALTLFNGTAPVGTLANGLTLYAAAGVLKIMDASANVATMFAATDTIVGKATTDTFTNKTFDTAGTGNSFSINGTAITAVTGTGSAVLATLPTITSIKLSTGLIYPTSDGASAVKFTKADGTTAVMTLDTNSNGVTFAGSMVAKGATLVGASQTVLDYSGISRLLAFGADASTKGSLVIRVVSSDVSLNTLAMYVAPSGGVTVGTSQTDAGALNLLVDGIIKAAGTTNTATTSAVCFNTSTFVFTYDGTIGTCTVSDGRLKDVEGPLTSALDKLLQIKGVYYRWKDPDAYGAGRKIGIIAQDVEAVFPELVSTDSEGKKSADYQRLVAPIIEAMRELKAANDNFAERISQLEAASRR